MSINYYHNNQVIAPWASPPKKSFPLKAVLAVVVVALCISAVVGWKWWTGIKVERATVVVCIDTNGDEKFEKFSSGVMVSPKGYVLTTRQSVATTEGKPLGKIMVRIRSGTKTFRDLEATIAEPGRPGANLNNPPTVRNDYAVLQVSSQDPLDYIEVVDKKSFDLKEAVTAYGYPDTDAAWSNDYGPQIKAVSGDVATVNTSNEGGVLYVTSSCAFEKGMEGGPLVQGGKLVGLDTRLGKDEYVSIPTTLLWEDVFKKYAGSK